MGVTGVYSVTITQFQNSYQMELHIKENKFDVIASMKDRLLTRSFFNGRTILSPEETESHNFIFYNAQVDNYVNLTPPGTVGDQINLRPPGGYHIGGVKFTGTVVNDFLAGTITLKNGLVSSIYGKRIASEPIVNTVFRTDGFVGVNRYCPCGTGSCTHHGFCDSCQIFESLHTPEYVGDSLPLTQCMIPEYEKLFGPIDRSFIEANKPKVEHGPHHLVE